MFDSDLDRTTVYNRVKKRQEINYFDLSFSVSLRNRQNLPPPPKKKKFNKKCGMFFDVMYIIINKYICIKAQSTKQKEEKKAYLASHGRRVFVKYI